jgi:hypothetical protein
MIWVSRDPRSKGHNKQLQRTGAHKLRGTSVSAPPLTCVVMRSASTLAVFATVGALSLQIGNAQTRCLAYEPGVVTLVGSLATETYPGAPNFESVADGDAVEPIWVVTLDDAICVDAADDINVAESGERRVQLVLRGEQFARYRDLLGRRIAVVGRLFHAHTGHHHTLLLLTTDEMREESLN